MPADMPQVTQKRQPGSISSLHPLHRVTPTSSPQNGQKVTARPCGSASEQAGHPTETDAACLAAWSTLGAVRSDFGASTASKIGRGGLAGGAGGGGGG